MSQRESGHVVDHDYLKKLVADIDSCKAGMDEQRTDMANLYKNAENDHGINRMALKQASS